MGVVNVTPDSFSDGGLAYRPEDAVERAWELVKAGADIIDVGGESTRPGAAPVSVDEELKRVLPVIEALSGDLTVPISVDTYKASVAEAALKEGAAVVNDISAAGFDPRMPEVVAKHQAGIILMHIRGTPRDMQNDPHYDDLFGEVFGYLQQAVARCKRVGIPEDHILVDPGIGFGKLLEHNLKLLRHLRRFKGLGAGVVVGPSRKSFVGLLTGKPVNERLVGTLAAVAAAALCGADVVRVHDVAEAVEALKVVDAIREAAEVEVL